MMKCIQCEGLTLLIEIALCIIKIPENAINRKACNIPVFIDFVQKGTGSKLKMCTIECDDLKCHVFRWAAMKSGQNRA